MKKLIILFLLISSSVFSFGQLTTNQNLTINRLAGRVWINGTGAQFRLYNTTFTEGSGTVVLAGGNFNVGANSILGSGSLGTVGSPFLKGWFTDLDVAGTLDLPLSLIWYETPILVSPTEFNYLEGVTGPIQAQINSISGGVTFNAEFTGTTSFQTIRIAGSEATKVEIDSLVNNGSGFTVYANGGVAQPPFIPTANRITLQTALVALGVNTEVITANLTDNAPTDAQIDAATSLTPATAGLGYKVTIKDGDGSGLLYLIGSDGTNWFYTVMTKAL